MKKSFTFLIIGAKITLSSLMIVSSATNRGATYQTEYPPEEQHGDSPNDHTGY